MNKYLNYFLKLNCSLDILPIINKINNKDKEITETIAVYQAAKKITDNFKVKTIYDFCTGSGLTSIFLAYMLKNSNIIAVDIRLTNILQTAIKSVQRLSFLEEDISDIHTRHDFNDSLIVACHPCKKTASTTIDIFNKSKAAYLVLIPCCIGIVKEIKIPSIIENKLNKYEKWSYSLYEKIIVKSENKDMFIDKNCISPKNIIITARK